MFKRTIVIFALMITSLSTQAFSYNEREEVHHGQRYLVQLKEPGDKEKILIEGIDGREVTIIRELESINAMIVEFTDGLEVDADEIEDDKVKTIKADRYRKWIEPESEDDLEVDPPRRLTVPDGVSRIKADTFRLGSGKKINATVAIIDTGIDAKHKSLNVVKQINFVENEDHTDYHGHGTHVAGTVGGINKGNGVVGVAPGAKLIALKVLNRDGIGSDTALISAVEWVTQHADEIDVVNMSLGQGRGYGDDLLHEAIKKSVEKGVVYVVAAGNQSVNIYHGKSSAANTVPAAYPEVMTVSAMVASDSVSGGYGPNTNAGTDDTIASFSNYSERNPLNNPVKSPGGGIDVAAPGVDILSTYPNNQFKVLSGTSMASPHAAGLVARYIAKHRNTLFPRGKKNAQTVYKIRQLFIDRAEPQDQWNRQGYINPSRSYHEGLIQFVK